jgi:hypothetical protein
MTVKQTLATLQRMGAEALPENKGYINRVQIPSSSSDRVYVVAQAKATGQWSCSCPAHIFQKGGTRKPCKHLQALGLGPAPAPKARKARRAVATVQTETRGTETVTLDVTADDVIRLAIQYPSNWHRCHSDRTN